MTKHSFFFELVSIAILCTLLHDNVFHKQKNMLIIGMILQMQPFHIICEKAFVGMIKRDTRCTVIVDTQHVFIQRSIVVSNKSGDTIVVIGGTDKWSVSIYFVGIS